MPTAACSRRSSTGAATIPADRESALLVAVPEAEPVVGAWRREHSPDARAGVPAHLTLLYPFVPAAELTDSHLDEVRAVVAGERAFAFRLARVERWPDVLYLAPEPAEPFIGLMSLLRHAYPQFPPYGDPSLAPVPHLTVAQNADDALFDRIEAALTPELPVEATAREVVLMLEGEDGFWRTRSRFPLA